MATKSSRQVSVVLRDCTLYFSEDEDSEDWQKMLQRDPDTDLLDPLDSSIVNPEIMINSEGEEEHHLENPRIPEEVEILPEPVADNLDYGRLPLATTKPPLSYRSALEDNCIEQMTEDCYEILELKKTLLADPLQGTDGVEILELKKTLLADPLQGSDGVEILELKKTLLAEPLQESDGVENCTSPCNSDKTPRWSTVGIPEVSTTWSSGVMDIPKAQMKLETQTTPIDERDNTVNVKRTAPVQTKIFITEISYFCVNCGISFSSAEDLKKLPSGHKVGALYLCPNCGRKLFQKNPRTGNQTDSVAENPYCCTECTRSFQNDDDLTRHQAFHLSNPYWCAECNEKFKNHRSLRAHRSLHMKERRFACKECGSKFENSFDLVVHRQIHNKKVEKPKKPEIKCRKRVHPGEKPFRCTVCDKCFVHQSELKVHERLHAG